MFALGILLYEMFFPPNIDTEMERTLRNMILLKQTFGFLLDFITSDHKAHWESRKSVIFGRVRFTVVVKIFGPPPLLRGEGYPVRSNMTKGF